MKDLKLRYGITKTDSGYEVESIDNECNEKQYDMYIAESFRTTAGVNYSIVNENREDLIKAKRWNYHASYGWGCVMALPDGIDVRLQKGREIVSFSIEEPESENSELPVSADLENYGDDDLPVADRFYLEKEFVKIMMLLLETCDTMDDAAQMLARFGYQFKREEDKRYDYFRSLLSKGTAAKNATGSDRSNWPSNTLNGMSKDDDKLPF